jgi:hypothetical protein
MERAGSFRQTLGAPCREIAKLCRQPTDRRHHFSSRHPRKRVIKYSRDAGDEPRSRGVLDTPLSRSMTTVCEAARRATLANRRGDLLLLVAFIKPTYRSSARGGAAGRRDRPASDMKVQSQPMPTCSDSYPRCAIARGGNIRLFVTDAVHGHKLICGKTFAEHCGAIQNISNLGHRNIWKQRRAAFIRPIAFIDLPPIACLAALRC